MRVPPSVRGSHGRLFGSAAADWVGQPARPGGPTRPAISPCGQYPSRSAMMAVAAPVLDAPVRNRSRRASAVLSRASATVAVRAFALATFIAVLAPALAPYTAA